VISFLRGDITTLYHHPIKKIIARPIPFTNPHANIFFVLFTNCRLVGKSLNELPIPVRKKTLLNFYRLDY